MSGSGSLVSGIVSWLSFTASFSILSGLSVGTIVMGVFFQVADSRFRCLASCSFLLFSSISFLRRSFSCFISSLIFLIAWSMSCSAFSRFFSSRATTSSKVVSTGLGSTLGTGSFARGGSDNAAGAGTSTAGATGSGSSSSTGLVSVLSKSTPSSSAILRCSSRACWRSFSMSSASATGSSFGGSGLVSGSGAGWGFSSLSFCSSASFASLFMLTCFLASIPLARL
mmetsp:Transcript_4656/g.16708  ORF Transcript_4656/g.16708 Transcript_4656/m.16708 type:complete len:226 (+) Transcript_4656:2678-3355(+)